MINLIVVLIICGFFVWLLNTIVPIDAKFKLVINALIALGLFLYALQVFGIWHGLPALRG